MLKKVIKRSLVTYLLGLPVSAAIVTYLNWVDYDKWQKMSVDERGRWVSGLYKDLVDYVPVWPVILSQIPLGKLADMDSDDPRESLPIALKRHWNTLLSALEEAPPDDYEYDRLSRRHRLTPPALLPTSHLDHLAPLVRHD